ncbi:MAG: lysylphosphatidylglycerol synthase transmembrane domain-containing protein [Acidobacteriota bacterium]|jgi:uncharacterized protein (TIRG00374 family)
MSPADPPSETPAEVQTWRVLRWLPGVLALLAFAFVIIYRSEEREFVRLMTQAEPRWLIAAALFQALTYVSATEVWQRTLVRRGAKLQLYRIVPLGLAKLFVDQVAPSGGVSGAVLAMSALKHRGISRGVATAALVTGLVSYYIAHALALFVAVGLLWRRGDLNVLILTVATVASLVAALVPVTVVGLRRGGDHPWLGRLVQRIPPLRLASEQLASAPAHLLSDRVLLLEATACQMGVILLDAATLSTLLMALGLDASPAAAFTSFVVAQSVANIIIVPGGFGTFDATCVGMLRLFGIPVGAGLTVAVLLRGFTFFLPMIPGLLLARRELRLSTTQDAR